MTHTPSPHIAFIDPFASASYLANTLHQAGITVSAIYTLGELNSNYLSARPDLFDHVFFLKNLAEVSSLIKALKKMKVDRIYYGCEHTVPIADRLAKEVCPNFANPFQTSLERCQKYDMQEALERANIPHVQQMKVHQSLQPEQIKALSDWVFPVIIKPDNNAGSGGVQLCNSIDEISEYLNNTLAMNIYGQSMDYFIIQELLEGDEYFVDTFSAQGKHQISGIQRYHRILFEQRPLCLYSEIVPLHRKEAVECISYVEKVLSAVQLNHGFGHTEIMLTKKGPYLIEVNPRISGASGANNALFHACGYKTQVELLIEDCQKDDASGSAPQQPIYGRKVYLYNFKERVIGDLNLTLLKTLPSFKEAIVVKKPGTMVPAPQSLVDAVAFALLAHQNYEQVEKDFNQILEWEKQLKLF